MNDTEIKSRTVSQCISSDYCRGWNDAVKESNEIINRQKKTIEIADKMVESLKAEVKRLKDFCDIYSNEGERAIKEFAERLKEKASSSVTSCQGREIYETKQYQMSAVGLDNLVKEMVGDDNA